MDGEAAEVVTMRGGFTVAGVAMFLAALALSNGAVESALIGDSGRSLAWGPALFRALLAFHGMVLLSFAARRESAPVAPRPARREGRPLPWVLLVSLSGVALALRLWRLDSGLWVDEVLTLLDYVRPPIGEILTRFPSQNQHMFYSVLAHASVRIFGESAVSLRLPAVLFGVGSLWALFLLGRRVVGDRESLLAAALMTVSYHHIWFSQNARGYTGLLFFATLATWLWLEARERDAWRWWFFYVAAVVLGLWVHMTMLFVVGTHPLVDLFCRKRGRLGWSGKGFAAWVLCGTLTAQLYAVSLPEFLTTALHEVSLPSEWTSLAWVVAESVRSLRVGFLGTAIVVCGAGLVAVGWFDLLRRDRAATLAMTLPPLLGGAAMLALGHNLWPRFFFFAMGFALLIAVHGAMDGARLALAAAGPRARKRWAVPAGTVLVACLIAASALTVPRCYALPKQDFAGARDYVEKNRRPGDGVVAVGLAGFVYGRYYAPRWSVAQNRAELDAVRAAHSAVWLVYTLPIQVRAYRADVWQVIESDFEVVKVFPGTLGGGAVYVCRSGRR